MTNQIGSLFHQVIPEGSQEASSHSTTGSFTFAGPIKMSIAPAVTTASVDPEPPNEIVTVRSVWLAKSREEMKRITKALEALGLKYTVEYFNDDKDYLISAEIEGERQ